MRETVIDSRRRVVLPKECPPGSKVTIEVSDPYTWIVRLLPSGVRFKRVLIPVVDKLPDDPEWDKVEKAFVAAQHLPPPPKD